MRLNYKVLGSGDPLIILHGLFGSLDNWQSVGKALSEKFTVYLVDERNHGKSPHHNDFSYYHMSEDLLEFFEQNDIDSAHIIGHSMGGKTAMKFAQNYPSYVEKLIVVDIAPKAYPVHHHQIIAGLEHVDVETTGSRKEAYTRISEYIEEDDVKQFLLKNMYWIEKGKLAWRFNLPVIKENIEIIGEAIEDRQYHGDTLFINGKKSDYIKASDYDSIKLIFPNAEFAEVKDAGHWVHAERPEEFLEILLNFL
ncbi:MAG: alpha/beta fold hydrolase [Flavobacteriales bacterium]|nr:alpha/beta fold hydrolase [Flavobacteriales bacterium]